MEDHHLEVILELGDTPSPRLDKALAAVVPEHIALSRSRLSALIKDKALSFDGKVIDDPSQKSVPGGTYRLVVPEVTEIEAIAQDIPLEVIFEDEAVIVVNKPAGMVVHPAPGTPDGTLVNALLHHCGDSLSGVGGARRPGIVHRIDKDTSGLLVVAKTDCAHQNLSKQFAKHSVKRTYQAVAWGIPSVGDPRLVGLPAVKTEAGGAIKISTQLGRHPNDRKKMAVAKSGGRHAVTRVWIEECFGKLASLVRCELETGRTHQIRVHMTHIGHPLLGDPVYGRARKLGNGASEVLKSTEIAFNRQALHARRLGFVHPETGMTFDFEADVPPDMEALIAAFRTSHAGD